MKKIIPQNDAVLCILEESNEKTIINNNLAYKINSIPLYKVVAIGNKAYEKFIDLNEGDVIRTNSTGTLVDLDNVKYYIFKAENIIGKVI